MIYEVELENLFTRAALLVEHESPTPNLNDFFASRMGFEFVMLYRDLNNKLHGLRAEILRFFSNRLKFPVYFGRHV
jgi:phenylpropionate dioxygenase-like ring-hydroxylating dioxygenase large terminal subunit